MVDWRRSLKGKTTLLILLVFSLVATILIQQDKAHWLYLIARNLLRAFFP